MRTQPLTARCGLQVRIKEAEEAAQGVEQPAKLLDLAEAYGVLWLDAKGRFR